jgi:class 3 adenylate cyclase
VGAERLREIMAELVDRCAVVVLRYGGTVDKFTGDGIMAVFGAPVALEDHAVRACLAALGVQEEAKRLAVDVQERDGVDLQLRVGLNSGQVIAGEIGSGPFGYTAVGEQVGMAQRMESAASPGGVMLSASTARLVEGAVTLGESELVQIKGADAPVPARRLLGMDDGHRAAALGLLAAFFDRLGRYEPAATIAGFAVTSPLAALPVMAEFTTAIAHLRDVLGEATYESLARKGETMTTAEMATYAYDQIDQARAELNAVSR